MNKRRLYLFISMIISCLFFYNAQEVNAAQETATYNGLLGAYYSSTGTEFAIWSSSASKIELILENEANPIELQQDRVSNVWKAYVAGDLINNSYTYTIHYENGDKYENVLDPYGKYLTNDGLKNIIYDESLATFEDWEYQDINISTSNSKKLIYGLNVSEYTSDTSWRGTSANRGKLLGIIETGVKYSGMAVGFDHIKSLGATYVEFNNIFNKSNPFIIDRSYIVGSDTDSYNIELKEVVNQFYKNGIGVVLTVSPFDFDESFLTNLNKIDREYYLNEYGKLNYDKYMVDRYIKDYVYHVVNEYKLEGLRIENTDKVSVNIVNELIDEIHTISEKILVYGQDGYYLEDNRQNNAVQNLNIINNSLSFGLFGELDNININGIIAKNFSPENQESLKFTLLNGVNNGDLNFSLVKGIMDKSSWESSNNRKLINPIGSLTGLTIHDKLYLSGITSQSEMLDKVVLAYGLQMISGGIPYISAGEEFLMSYNSIGSTENSICDGEYCFYTKDANVNIDWGRAYINEELTNRIRSLVNFRNKETSFIQTNAQSIKNYVTIYENENMPGVIGYVKVNKNPMVNQISKISVLFNFSDNEYQIEDCPGKNWIGLYNYNEAQREGDIINITPNSIHIEYELKKPKFSGWVTLIFIVVLIGGIFVLNTFLSQKLLNRDGNIKEIKRKYRPFIKKNVLNSQENNEPNEGDANSEVTISSEETETSKQDTTENK